MPTIRTRRAAAVKPTAERLRARVAAAPLECDNQTIGITVSIGLTMARPTDRAIEQILARADARLYPAKRAGRNRVRSGDVPVKAAARA